MKVDTERMHALGATERTFFKKIARVLFLPSWTQQYFATRLCSDLFFLFVYDVFFSTVFFSL